MQALMCMCVCVESGREEIIENCITSYKIIVTSDMNHLNVTSIGVSTFTKGEELFDSFFKK